MNSNPYNPKESTLSSDNESQVDIFAQPEFLNPSDNDGYKFLSSNPFSVPNSNTNLPSFDNSFQASDNSISYDHRAQSDKVGYSGASTIRSATSTRTLPPKSSFHAERMNRKNLRISTAVKPGKDSSRTPFSSQNENRRKSPSLLNEYKYRKSYSGKSVIKEWSNGDRRELKVLSIFSPSRIKSDENDLCNSINLDSSLSISPKPAGHAKRSSKLNNQQSELNNTIPFYRPAIFDQHVETLYSFDLSNSDNDEEDTGYLRPLVRTRLQRVFRRTLLASYFIGVMFAFRNRVQLYGAIRPIEYYEVFEEKKEAVVEEYSFLPIRPTSSFSLIWMAVLIFLVTSSAVLTPVIVSFADDKDPFFGAVDSFFDAMFSFDIAVNFVSAYYDDSSHQLVTSFKSIALHYFRGWFWIDFASVLPFDTIVYSLSHASASNSATRSSKLLRLLRFPRLYKMLRILRVLKIIKMISGHPMFSKMMKKINLNMIFVDLIRSVVNFIFLNHIVGCLWFFVARMENFSPNTWVALNGLLDENKATQYLASLYWSFQAFTTVGFGDIEMGTDLETGATICWFVVSVGFHSLFIADLVRILAHFNDRSGALQSRILAFHSFANTFQVPDFLRQKVQRFMELNHRENIYHWIDPKEVLKGVPTRLKSAFLLFSYYSIIKNIDILQVNANFTAALLTHLKLLKLKTGEILYREMDPAHEIYFISKGSVDMVTEKLEVIFSLGEGAYFGEMEILDKEMRKTFSISTDTTVLLVCPRNIFLTALEDFPVVQEKIREVSKFRKLRLQAKKERFKAAKVAVTEDKENLDIDKLGGMTEYMNLLIYNAQVVRNKNDETFFGIKMDKKRPADRASKVEIKAIEGNIETLVKARRASYKQNGTLLDSILAEKLRVLRRRYRRSIRKDKLSSEEMTVVQKYLDKGRRRSLRRSTQISLKRSAMNLSRMHPDLYPGIEEDLSEESSPEVEGKVNEEDEEDDESSSSSSDSQDSENSKEEENQEDEDEEEERERNQLIRETSPLSTQYKTGKTEEIRLLTEEPMVRRGIDDFSPEISPMLIASERVSSHSRIISYEKVPSLYNTELSTHFLNSKPTNGISPNLRRPLKLSETLRKIDNKRNIENYR